MDRRGFLGRALLVLALPSRGVAALDRRTSSAPSVGATPSLPTTRASFPIGGDLVASGGLCSPISPIYNVPALGVSGRPVRDSLPTFQAVSGDVWDDELRRLLDGEYDPSQ